MVTLAIPLAIPAPPASAQTFVCPANLEQGSGCASSDSGSAGAPPLPTVYLGNPVSLVTGAKRQRETDFALEGAPLAFHRYYDSGNSDIDVGLGPGWRHTLAVSLLSRANGDLEIIESSGRRVRFHRLPDEPSVRMDDTANGASERSGGGVGAHPVPDVGSHGGAVLVDRTGAHAGGGVDVGADVDVDVGVDVISNDVASADSTEAPEVSVRVRYRPGLPSDGFIVEESGRHTWHLPDGRTLRFQGSYLVRIDWPVAASVAAGAPRFLTFHYRYRRLSRVADEAGRVLHLEYAPTGGAALRNYDGPRAQSRPGNLSALVLPDGSRVTYSYDTLGNLAEARFANGTARRYHYEDPIWPNHLTGLTERTGTRFATWHYDDRGRAISSEHADGVERVSLTFDTPADRGEAVGAIGTTTVTDSLGATSIYTWRRDPSSGASLLMSATGPGCATCPPTGRRYTYTADARLERVTRLDDDGTVLTERRYTWTANGRLATVLARGSDGIDRLIERREYIPGVARPAIVARPSVNGAGEHTIATTFDPGGAPTSITERGFAPIVTATARAAAGEVTHDRRDASAPSTDFVPIERTTRFAYTDGRLTAIDGPREDIADITRLERDANIPSRLVAVHPPTAPAIRLLEHDASGRPRAFSFGTGSPWHVERDAHGDVVRLAHRGFVVRWTRDAEGRVTAITDTDGRTLSLEHDAAGRPARITDDLGRVTHWLTDTEGRMTRLLRHGFDGSLVRSIQRYRDARGHGDAVGKERFAEDDSVEFDGFARIRTSTDARANRTETLHDDFGRIVRLDSPDTGVTVNVFDAAGNRIQRVHESGATTAYTYDAADRLATRTDAEGTTEWVYGTEGGAHGRVIEARNDATVERFSYDAESQLVVHVREIDGHAFETRYTHDERGRLVDKRLPDGQTLRHHYHESGLDRGRLRAITRGRWLGLANEMLVAEIDTDSRDGKAGHVSHGGLATRRRHAANGEITSLEIGRALRLDYRFDAAGRIIGIEENGSPRRYAYTDGRLSLVDSASGTITYVHDAVGNRLERTVRDENGSRRTRYRHAPPGRGNRLLAVVDEGTGHEREYVYASDGTPRAAGALAYTYDAERRPLTASRDGRLLARYAYNAFGERVRKIVYPETGLQGGDAAEPITTYFLYDGSTLAAEADGTGRVTSQYVYLDGHRAVAKLEGRTAYAIHGDHLGTPRLMTDADGRVVWRATYAPFGEATVDVESVRLDLRLPGQYADSETDTHYNYHRDYDPSTGRYVTSDPIGLAGGANTYAYVDADPLSEIDPLGLLELSEAALRDPEIQRQMRRLGLNSPIDEIRGQPRLQGSVAKPAVRIVARAAPYLTLFALAYDGGHNGARILDQLIFQPNDHVALVAAIKVYRSDYVDPHGNASRVSIAALAQTLRRVQIDYLDDTGGACPADQDLYNQTVLAVEGVDGLVDRILAPTAFTSPEGIQFPSEAAYVAARSDYDAAGGAGTGKDFGDWWAERLAGATAVEAERPTQPFPNQLPELLNAELETAESAGVVRVRANSPAFATLVETGETLIWAIDEEGVLFVAPQTAAGETINHSILTAGAPVLSAGEISIIESGRGGYVILDINNSSGHFRPSDSSLEWAKGIFERNGILEAF